ncbi:MAG TPA: hypothetical protein VF546_13405 [Pyrinomonadaceae bacterium]|jgi:hypothetical protein
MLRHLTIGLILSGLVCGCVSAQTGQGAPPTVRGGREDPRDPADNTREEMLRTLEIKRAENSHKQNVERAKEGALLGVELRDSYARQKALGADDLKKLGRLEKLARQLRSGTGGEDDEEPLKDPPHDLTAALTRIADCAEELRKSVEKTPRQVVSAAVIAQANELFELVRVARTLTQ